VHQQDRRLTAARLGVGQFDAIALQRLHSPPPAGPFAARASVTMLQRRSAGKRRRFTAAPRRPRMALVILYRILQTATPTAWDFMSHAERGTRPRTRLSELAEIEG
jgi:hypothetical protein